MLSVEQIAANDFNPVLLLSEKRTRRLSVNAEESKSLEVKEPQIKRETGYVFPSLGKKMLKHLPEDLFSVLIKLLGSDTFIRGTIPCELKITFLQFVAIIFEKGIELQHQQSQLFTDTHLIPFLKKLIENLHDNEVKTLEGSISLYLLLKVMKEGGREVIEKIFQDDQDLE